MNRTQVTDLITRYNGNRGISVEVIYDYGCSDTLIDPSHVCGENYGVAVLSADGRQSTYDFTLALQFITNAGVDTTPSTPLAQYSVKCVDCGAPNARYNVLFDETHVRPYFAVADDCVHPINARCESCVIETAKVRNARYNERQSPQCAVCGNHHAMFTCNICDARVCPDHGYSKNIDTDPIVCQNCAVNHRCTYDCKHDAHALLTPVPRSQQELLSRYAYEEKEQTS